MLDEFEAETYIPGHLASARLEIGEFVFIRLVEAEGEVGAGEDIRAEDAAKHRDSEFIFEVDGDLEEIFTVDIVFDGDDDAGFVSGDGDVGGIVHAGIHEAGVEGEADDGDSEFHHWAGGPAAGIVRLEEIIVEGDLVDEQAGLYAEFKLGVGGAGAEDGDGQR